MAREVFEFNVHNALSDDRALGDSSFGLRRIFAIVFLPEALRDSVYSAVSTHKTEFSLSSMLTVVITVIGSSESADDCHGLFTFVSCGMKNENFRHLRRRGISFPGERHGERIRTPRGPTATAVTENGLFSSLATRSPHAGTSAVVRDTFARFYRRRRRREIRSGPSEANFFFSARKSLASAAREMENVYPRHAPVLGNLTGSGWTVASRESVLSLVVVLGSSVSLVGLIFAFITYRCVFPRGKYRNPTSRTNSSFPPYGNVLNHTRTGYRRAVM